MQDVPCLRNFAKGSTNKLIHALSFYKNRSRQVILPAKIMFCLSILGATG